MENNINTNINTNNNTNYNCIYCYKLFTSKHGKIKHETKACKLNPNYKKTFNVKECKFCHKIFANKQYRYVHQKSVCKLNPDNIINIDSNIILHADDNENNIDLPIPNNQSNIVLHADDNKNNIALSMPNNQCNIDLPTSNNGSNIITDSNNKFIINLDKNYLTFNDSSVKYFYYNEQVYFKATDIAIILEYENITQAIENNVNIDDKIRVEEFLKFSSNMNPSIYMHLESENERTIFINESGFYCIVLASKNPIAYDFKKIITSVVLPAIRKKIIIILLIIILKKI
jgi:hypothetical protein